MRLKNCDACVHKDREGPSALKRIIGRLRRQSGREKAILTRTGKMTPLNLKTSAIALDRSLRNEVNGRACKE
jgi:hypothetical protein